MLVITPTISIADEEFEFSFARSPGPGGQNVNKVNSKALLKWSVENNQSLPEPVKLRFLEQYKNRISKEGLFSLTSHRYRDQGRNVTDCLDKLRDLILAVVPEPIKRKPRRVSQGAKRRRLDAKKMISDKKQNRTFRAD